MQSSWTGEQFELPAEDELRIQVRSWVTEDAARKLVKLAGRDLDELVGAAKSRDFAPVALGVKTSIKLPTKLSSTTTANVLGVIEGSDPALSREVVIYTAHHDHLGIGKPDAEGEGRPPPLAPDARPQARPTVGRRFDGVRSHRSPCGNSRGHGKNSPKREGVSRNVHDEQRA